MKNKKILKIYLYCFYNKKIKKREETKKDKYDKIIISISYSAFLKFYLNAINGVNFKI